MLDYILRFIVTLLIITGIAFLIPAHAQIVNNSLNPTGVELTLCETIAEYAEDVSNLRQNGAKYSDVIAVAPKPTTQAEKDIKLILDEITYTAWQLNIVESK